MNYLISAADRAMNAVNKLDFISHHLPASNGVLMNYMILS